MGNGVTGHQTPAFFTHLPHGTAHAVTPNPAATVLATHHVLAHHARIATPQRHVQGIFTRRLRRCTQRHTPKLLITTQTLTTLPMTHRRPVRTHRRTLPIGRITQTVATRPLTYHRTRNTLPGNTRFQFSALRVTRLVGFRAHPLHAHLMFTASRTRIRRLITPAVRAHLTAVASRTRIRRIVTNPTHTDLCRGAFHTIRVFITDSGLGTHLSRRTIAYPTGTSRIVTT